MQKEEVWKDAKLYQSLQRKAKFMQQEVDEVKGLEGQLQDLYETWQLAEMEEDEHWYHEAMDELEALERLVDRAEIGRMFTHPMDEKAAFVEIQAGSGGTEAQDWAEMLYRMYSRWFDRRGFTVSVLDWSVGDVAGIKGASLRVDGDKAYGWLRTETGIHRLVRKSPFDSGGRRHTSFASVYVTPEIDDQVEIDILPQDLRIDTYRSSGAGGQHVNTTDSAVRITHVPTQIVVQCQSERSQHQNKARAMAQLRAKLYDHQRKLAEMESQKAQAGKDEISWGRQIRSYVLDQSRIKDLRTGHESMHPQGVLDGDLDGFVEASLRQGVGEVKDE